MKIVPNNCSCGITEYVKNIKNRFGTRCFRGPSLGSNLVPLIPT